MYLVFDLKHVKTGNPFMARSWLVHGSFMARSWLVHGSFMARSCPPPEEEFHSPHPILMNLIHTAISSDYFFKSQCRQGA